MKKEIIQTLKIVSLGLVVSASFAFANSWTTMPSTPPSSNTVTPVNVGPASQVKTGALGVGPLAVFGESKLNGNVNILQDLDSTKGKLYVSGKVGIGLKPTALTEKFEVNGNIKILTVAYPNNDLKPHVCVNTSGTLVSCP